MGEHDDKVFLKRFSGIIAGLVIVTILIIIIALGNDTEELGSNPSKAILAEKRVAPVSGVRTEIPKTTEGPVTVEVADNVVLQPSQEPDNSEAAEESSTPAASTAGIDGAALYAGACAACHAAGVAGAPIPGTDSMAERAAKGLDAVVAAAIAGVGPIMQPKGGRADLSDEEIRVIVEHMIAQ